MERFELQGRKIIDTLTKEEISLDDPDKVCKVLNILQGLIEFSTGSLTKAINDMKSELEQSNEQIDEARKHFEEFKSTMVKSEEV